MLNNEWKWLGFDIKWVKYLNPSTCEHAIEVVQSGRQQTLVSLEIGTVTATYNYVM